MTGSIEVFMYTLASLNQTWLYSSGDWKCRVCYISSIMSVWLWWLELCNNSNVEFSPVKNLLFPLVHFDVSWLIDWMLASFPAMAHGSQWGSTIKSRKLILDFWTCTVSRSGRILAISRISSWTDVSGQFCPRGSLDLDNYQAKAGTTLWSSPHPRFDL